MLETLVHSRNRSIATAMLWFLPDMFIAKLRYVHCLLSSLFGRGGLGSSASRWASLTVPSGALFRAKPLICA